MKRSLAIIIIILLSLKGFSQMKVFQAPSFADTIHNPIKDIATAASAGQLTYKTFCVPCHGQKGRGDGVAAAGLQKPPADHTAAIVQKQTDGALFWMISTGNNPMPGYKGALTDQQIWQLVSYIRTLAKASKK